jgi:DnaJ like chaperone protein
MSLFKSVVGGALGFMVGGPMGAILGAGLAYQFSKHDALGIESRMNEPSQTQTAFLIATFSVMGHVAKLDGRVCPEAISYAKRVMNELNLDTELRGAAINLFRQGKKADFRLEPVLAQLYQQCQHRPDLLQRFLTIQLHTAVVDGILSEKEDALLWQLCSRLRMSRFFYERLKIQLLAQHYFYQQKAQIQSLHTDSLAEAYRVLGLTTTATPAEVKQAYRRLMNQHHPDKLAAKGLSEAAMNLAKEKTQQISKAYETIQKRSGA